MWVFMGDLRKYPVISKTKHRDYTAMANFLDKNQAKFKNRVMYAKGNRNHWLSNKVVFDGYGTWVENYGSV
jgi:hypothetical protein